MPHQTLQTLAEAYGPIMGIKLGLVKVVMTSSFAAAQKFLKEAAFMDRPACDASVYLAYGPKGVIFSDYGANWRESATSA